MRRDHSRREFIKTASLAALGVGSSAYSSVVTPSARYEPSWESLKQYRVPEWYRDAKFGIFLHWGVYAVPAYSSEWYPREMYIKGSDVFNHHRKTYGPQSVFGYKDFIPKFTAKNWDPDRWAALFRKAGARYVVPVGEHHDGFPMYECSYTEWNAARMGPRRDVVGELGRAVRKQGLKLGVSSHRAFNWSYYTFDKEFDTSDPKYSGLYGKPHAPTRLISDKPGELRQSAPQEFVDDWYRRSTEIVNKYQPDLMWFDFGFEAPEYLPYRKRLAAYYYNKAEEWGRGVVLNHKHDAYPEDVAVLDIERGLLGDIRKRAWQTDTSVGWKSWGFIQDESFKSVDQVVHELIDIASKNGCLLLNVGPQADGTIPEAAEKVLRGIGQWLEVNGEAVYGTRAWKIFGEGPTRLTGGYFGEKNGQNFTSQDIRFVAKNGVIYAICLAWPGEELKIKSLGTNSGLTSKPILDVKLLGSDAKLEWGQAKDSLTIAMPNTKPCDNAFAFKIILKA